MTQAEQFSLEVEKRAILKVGLECLYNSELVTEFNRLTGCRLLRSANRSPLEIAIDKACGYDGENNEDWEKWTKFVMDTVWLRLPEAARRAFCVEALAEILEGGDAK